MFRQEDSQYLFISDIPTNSGSYIYKIKRKYDPTHNFKSIIR